jgi:hypothetical protein
VLGIPEQDRAGAITHGSGSMCCSIHSPAKDRIAQIVALAIMFLVSVLNIGCTDNRSDFQTFFPVGDEAEENPC